MGGALQCHCSDVSFSVQPNALQWKKTYQMDVALVYRWDGLETTKVTKVQVVTIKCDFFWLVINGYICDIKSVK